MIVLKIFKLQHSDDYIFRLYKDTRLLYSFVGKYEYQESLTGSKFIYLKNNSEYCGVFILDIIDKIYINDELIKGGLQNEC